MKDDTHFDTPSAKGGPGGDRAAPAGSVDPDLLAIRAVMEFSDSKTESKVPPKLPESMLRKSASRMEHDGPAAPPATFSQRNNRAAPTRGSGGRAEAERPVAARVTEARRKRRRLRQNAFLQWFVARAASFLRRPDAPWLLAAAALLILVLWKPGLAAFLCVMALLAALVLYFSLGPDRVESWVIARFQRLRARDPEAAERLRRRAATASRWLAALMNRLPERWTSGLYLPDFEGPAGTSAQDLPDPFDRLAKQ